MGGFYTFDFSALSIANVIKDRIGDQLKNIDNLLIRNEYKARIYAQYFLGANRFVFSVHDLCLSQLDALNNLTHRYLKKWLGMPNGASWALIHDAHGLDIKSISHLYMESRALSLSKIKLFGDERVRHALDCKEEREGKWCRKFSSATYVKGLVDEVVPQVAPESVNLAGQNLDQSLDLFDQFSPLPADVVEAVAAAEVEAEVEAPAAASSSAAKQRQLKRKIQVGVQQEVNDFWKEKIGHYVMQGDYLALLMEEGDCVTWKSYLWDIPQGVLKFAINAGINTLPTLDNLKRWGKRVNDRCPFCGNIQTLAHVLSNCTSALDQGRFTWRHNSVLKTIIGIVSQSLKEGCELFSDLDGFQAPHGGTIPPDILVTVLRPDLVIVNRQLKRFMVFELTCPWDSNIENAHSFKDTKYAPLVADLSNDYKVFHYSVEVSVRGQLTKSNRARLKSMAYEFCYDSKKITKSLVKHASKASLLCSYSIFSARNEPTWSSPPYLIAR